MKTFRQQPGGTPVNDWQVAKQLKHIIQKISWDDTVANLFKEVFVCPEILGAPEKVLKNHLVPLCLIGVGAYEVVPHRPDEINQSWSIAVITEVEGDDVGESTILGINRTIGANGKGLLEYMPLLRTAIKCLSETEGLQFQLLSGSGAATVKIGENYAKTTRTLEYASRITLEKTYTKSLGFRITSPPNDIVDLEWPLQPDRFDAVDMIMRKSTSGFPQTKDDGTAVILAGQIPGILNGGGIQDIFTSPGTTYYYSMFTCYDEYLTGLEANYRYSDEPATQKVVRV